MMHAVLSVPASWQKQQAFRDLSNPTIIQRLGRAIAETFRSSHALYHTLPTEIPVEVEWVRDGHETPAKPLLAITADGIATMKQHESVGRAVQRLSSALQDAYPISRFPHGCRIRLTIVTTHELDTQAHPLTDQIQGG